MTWKRSLRRIPDVIWAKLQQLQGTPIRAGVVRAVSRLELETGVYRHLDLALDNGQPTVQQARVVPPRQVGRWSRTNLHGKTIVRKDLPKITRAYSTEAPNFGDWSKGSHTIDWTREVYQRQLVAPKGLAIEIEVLGREPGPEEKYLIRFTVEEVLNQDAPNFEDDLFYNLNVLQENAGGCDVFPADATRDDYLRTLYVDWEILPPGTRDANLAVILRTVPTGNIEERRRFAERYDFLAGFGPTGIISGTSGFHRYFGAQYGDALVVFEHLEYGNATYVMGAAWAELSRLSRTELMARFQQGYRRIPHTRTWRDRLAHIIGEHQRGRTAL